jgi:hypothetical protein
MKLATENAPATISLSDAAARQCEQRVERLIDRLPKGVQATTAGCAGLSHAWCAYQRVCCSSSVASTVFSRFSGSGCCRSDCCCLHDVPPLRRGLDRALDRIEQQGLHWLASSDAKTTTYTSTRRCRLEYTSEVDRVSQSAKQEEAIDVVLSSRSGFRLAHCTRRRH